MAPSRPDVPEPDATPPPPAITELLGDPVVMTEDADTGARPIFGRPQVDRPEDPGSCDHCADTQLQRERLPHNRHRPTDLWLCPPCRAIDCLASHFVNLQREVGEMRREQEVCRATAAEAREMAEQHRTVLIGMRQVIEDSRLGYSPASCCLHLLGSMVERLLVQPELEARMRRGRTSGEG